MWQEYSMFTYINVIDIVLMKGELNKFADYIFKRLMWCNDVKGGNFPIVSLS